MDAVRDGTKAEVRAEMRCPKCGGDGAIQIRITLHTEERLDFQSCHRCEHRWWKGVEDREVSTLPLTEVLDRATVKKSA